MKTSFKKIVAGLTFAMCSIGSVQAAVFTENFEEAFPAWESNWLGTLSNARNYYCNGALGCTTRGNNPDGLWVVDSSYGVSPNVVFDTTFGASLVSLKLDIAAYVSTTLSAYDKDNALIFSENVVVNAGAYTDPGTYSTYTISSTNGISRFTFSGGARGNTSIDNLVAVTQGATVPEPTTVALLGLGLLGFAASRRKTAKK